MATVEQAALYSAIDAALGFKPKAVKEHVARFKDLDVGFTDILNRNPVEADNFRQIYDKAFDAIKKWEGVHIIRRGETCYPTLLEATPNPPEFLFVRGDVEALMLPGVSVVGSRTASEDGKVRAFRIARLLCENNFAVFSGLAKGIDTAAHLGALKVQGKTIAVIGTTIDKYYPKENMELQNLIAEKGAVVSQFSPLNVIQKLNFPLRNETMSGLSLATVIVEASETSGALIQARHTLKQRRQLFIMQNQIERSDLAWPAQYLNKGAKAMSEFEELLSALKASPPSSDNSDGGQLRML